MALKDIIGQDKAISILRGALMRGRLPSSYLFAGESGIGKRFTAINLAKTLNCHNVHLSPGASFSEDLHRVINNQLIDCCDECPSCRKIDSQSHPDFLMIAPEKNEIKVEEIRAVEEALAYAPYEGRMKVAIIDDADAMNASAANAFLKTLEEPSHRSIIILITSHPYALPETIRSRCSRINFLPLSPEKCEEVIKKQRHEEGGHLSAISRLSMGRPGLAISNDLIEERDWFLRLFRAMIPGNKEEWTKKEDIEKWFNLFFIFVRDMAVLKITGREDMIINTDLIDKISSLSKKVEIRDIIKCYVKLSSLMRYLDFNLNRAITWNYTSVVMQNLKIKMQD